ncbi:hypothetical protein HPULCUR_001145 [Helicostylum pulchrum]|uniref:SWIM-type domain-containing protein n=1 Tax=Helicostylum pulchrum TaxID=562976 RepID=A0ABP9XMX4_9FUNG
MALRNSLDEVFPEVSLLLCYWHLANNLESNHRPLFLGDSKAAVELLVAETRKLYENIVDTRTEPEMVNAINVFKAEVYIQDNFKDKEGLEKAKKYFEITSNRAESAHSAMKTAIGNISSGQIALVTDRIDTWYRKAERSSREEIKMLGLSSLLFDKQLEYNFAELKNKVVRFAMDRIRESVSRESCNCENPVNYDIPCYHTLLIYDVIPLTVVPNRWRIELDKYDNGNIIMT